MTPAPNRFETILTKHGDILTGNFEGPARGSKRRDRTVPRGEWSADLAEQVATMADGDTIRVEIAYVAMGSGTKVARPAGLAPLYQVPPEDTAERTRAVTGGGFVNPYTFVPALPRDGLAGTDYHDGPPPSHATHQPDQWSGTITVTLTTRTPLLLPVPVREQPGGNHNGQSKVFDTRTGPDGRPQPHPASVKGALRSAFETVTASRFGVFADHDHPLAYRATAASALTLVPARVVRTENRAYFQLCQGDQAWQEHSEPNNVVQDAAWVPAYARGPQPLLRRLGRLNTGELSDHHGSPVSATLRLYQYHRAAKGTSKDTRFKVWRVTSIAATRAELTAGGANRADTHPPERWGHLTLADRVPPRIVTGWLSATRYSIESKHDERLFVATPDSTVPLTADHERYWQAVLHAYDDAAAYNEPNDTGRRRPSDPAVRRSLHVNNAALRDLPHGTLVYLRRSVPDGPFTEVQPVMIGRLPFAGSPAQLLDPSLHPATDRTALSPADRLFGWVPTGGSTNDGASGYRGRLVIREVVCNTDDWRPEVFPADGITLAPLSSPKPTQFRFYAATGQDTAAPVRRATPKNHGYSPGGGLRGRKMYRWRDPLPANHWQPPTDDSADPTRDYLATPDLRVDKPKQVTRHRSWVRPGVTFQVTIFLDGISTPDLGALLWLLDHGDRAPLRLGAGKPYGFGVLTAAIDWDATRLWTGHQVRAGWLGLTRPDPASVDEIAGTVAAFAAAAKANPVLREATESYLRAAAPVDGVVHYPRPDPDPTPENFRWFTTNEGRDTPAGPRGWPLPHVRDPEQRLPYLPHEKNKPPLRPPRSDGSHSQKRR